MAAAVIMPKAGITVESCIMGAWQKKAGDAVKIGEILFSYETDKAVFECESTAEGELLELFFREGDEVPVLTPVCVVGTKGEDVSALRPGASAPAPASAVAAEASGPAAPSPEAAGSPPVQAPVSPRARGLARRSGAELSAAVPTGPHGRVIERDVRALLSGGSGEGFGGRGAPAQPAAAPAPVPAEAPARPAAPAPATERGGYTDLKFTLIRKSIARAMRESLASAAQLTSHHSFDATQILAYRRQLKAMEGREALRGVTLNDMVVFAVTRTLPAHPDLNAHLLEGDVLRRFERVHLGVAVDTPRGLIVPTLFDADRKSLCELSAETKALAEQARSGKISPDLLTGGTFSLTNLGTLGVEMFTPVINPPQTAILGVCAIRTALRETEDGQAKPYPAMGLSLTYDHRAVDGAPAARFMKDLTANLEQFTALLAL